MTYQNLIIVISSILFFALLISLPALGKLFAKCEMVAARIGRSWTRTLALVFAAALLTAIVPAVIWGVPIPAVHDEFAYLLSGDTFARFRLTNPPPPANIAPFLETFHVIVTPSYSSKFPVAQGMALAVGYWLGQPIIGVWLSVAAGCAALTWMLGAFVPRRWALIGGLLCCFFTLVNWWQQSYWGGGVALIGGSLFIGAAARAVRRRPRAILGFVLGLGLGILANSRPLEGLLLAFLVFWWMIYRAIRQHMLAELFTRIVLPAALVIAPTLAFMGYYNYRVTGDALTLPYVVHAKQYMTAPLLFGQPMQNLTYRHDVFARFFKGNELREYLDQVGHLPAAIWAKWQTILFYFTLPLAVVFPLIASIIAGLRGNKAARFALAILLLLPTIHMIITPWFRVTYLAPILGLLFVLLIVGLRQLMGWRVGSFPIGAALARVAMFSVIASAIVWAPRLAENAHSTMAEQRQTFIGRRLREGGKHLVFVRYGPRHDPLFDFVFNRADLQTAPVIFVRSTDAASDQMLMNYFAGRRVWDLYEDGGLYQVNLRG